MSDFNWAWTCLLSMEAFCVLITWRCTCLHYQTKERRRQVRKLSNKTATLSLGDNSEHLLLTIDGQQYKWYPDPPLPKKLR